MQIFHYMFIALLCYFLTACKAENSISSPAVVSADEFDFSEEEEFTFSTFSTRPNELERCYCLLAEDEESFFQKKYIFISDNNEYKEEGDNIGFLGHKDQWIRFRCTHLNKLQRNDVSMRYKGGQFELVVLLKPFERMDNSHWAVRGQLSLRTPYNKIVSKDLYGECLCEQ
jgi:hypothetical protein